MRALLQVRIVDRLYAGLVGFGHRDPLRMLPFEVDVCQPPCYTKGMQGWECSMESISPTMGLAQKHGLASQDSLFPYPSLVYCNEGKDRPEQADLSYSGDVATLFPLSASAHRYVVIH